MPGANCAFPRCGVSRNYVGVGIFKVPSRNDIFYMEWRKNLLGILTKYRVVDKDFKKRIEKGNVYICERHFVDEDIERTSKLQSLFTYFDKFSVGLLSGPDQA